MQVGTNLTPPMWHDLRGSKGSRDVQNGFKVKNLGKTLIVA